MNTRLLGAALLLLLGFVVWLIWIRPDQPPSLPAPTDSSDDGSPSAVTASLTPDPKVGVEDLERTAVDQQGETSWVVRGEVMHGSVAPLPGAHFKARIFSGPQADGEPLREDTLVSDEHGGFEWALPPPSGTVTLGFAQCASDTAIMAGTRTMLVGDGPPQDVTVFAFLKDCQVTGTVTDLTHKPIAGAWVKGSFRDEPQPCTAAGQYSMVTSATYGDTAVVAGAPGYVLAKQSVKVKGRNAKVVVDFELKPAVRLAGRVTDEGNAPLPAASVYTFDTHAAAVRTDADGRYELTNIDPAREDHTVQVEHDDYLTSQRTVTRQQLDEACDLVMKRGARVSGRVFGAGDRAVAGAHIHLGEWIGYLGNPRAVSREDGTFEVRNVRPGDGHLSVFARGYAPDQRRVDVPEGKTEVVGLLVRLEPGHFVAGRVVDREGNGLRRVRITPMAAQSQREQLGSETYTARDGSFRLTDLPAGKINLDCFGMQSTRKEEQGVAVDRADVTIVMERSVRLAGRVLDDATGRPLARFSIRFVTPELRGGERQGGGYGVEWVNGLVFEDCDGYWSTDTEHLDASGIYGVEATAEGYGPAVLRRAQPKADAKPDAVLRLRPAARITGRVVDQRTGAGIAGAQLAVYNADHPLGGRESFDNVRFACRTGEQGTFELAGLPAGQVSLALQHPDWPLTFDGPFETVAGATTNRILSVRAGATLTGTALDLQGNPVAGVTIVRQMIEIGGVRMPHASTKTDAAGRFRFPALPTARYCLLASGLLADGSTIVYSRNVDVTADEDVDLQLEPAGRGAIEVEILADGALPQPLSVHIRRPAANSIELPFSCSASGSTFVVRGLPAGECHVSVMHYSETSLVSGSGSVNASAEGTARVQIRVTARKH